MAKLTLELNINSASNLVNVNFITKMDVYAAISIRGDDTQKKHKVKTSVDRSGGSNQTWNHVVKFVVNERLARDGCLTLIIRLMSRGVLSNKDIGGVNVPLLELLNTIMPLVNGDVNDQEMKVMTYRVRKLSGKRSGSLTFSYRFISDFSMIVNQNSVDTVDKKLTAYPPPSEIMHSPSIPPELPFEFPMLPQPPYQSNSDHQNHSFATESNNDPLPISYKDVMEQPYDKSGDANNHTQPPPIHQGNEQYKYAPQSHAEYDYGNLSYKSPKRLGFGFGLEAELLGGLIIGDIVSDVANSFDF